MDFLNYICEGGFSRSKAEREELENNGEILREDVNDYTIDSCHTWDAGYETAIWNNTTGNPMVIVEYYYSFDDMKKGHKKWCKFCESNPKEVYSVQTNEIEKL